MAELTIISPSTNPYILDTQGNGYIAGESVPIQIRYPAQYRGQVSISMVSYADPDFPAFTPYRSKSFSDLENTVEEYSTAWTANYGSSPRSASLSFIPVWTGTGDSPFDGGGVTQEIYQAGLTPIVLIGSVSVSPSEVSVASQSGFSTVYVTYASASSGGYDIKSPSLSAGVESLILGSSSIGESKIVTYSLSYPANTSTSPVTHSATFAMSRSVDIKTATTYIYQAEAPSSPLPVGSVVIPGSPYTVGANTQSQEVVVIYSESVNRYTIQTPGYGDGVTSVSFVNSQSVGNNTIVTWSVNFPVNATPETKAKWVAFQMQSGSDDPVYKQAWIYQQGRGVVAGSITVGPYNPLNVTADTTSSTFFVTYSNANSGEYDIKDPITGSSILSITKSTQSLGNDVYGTYTIKYPANTSIANSVTRSLVFTMSSSNDIQRSIAYVYQAKDTPSYSINCTESVSKNSSAFRARYKVKYNGVLYSDDIEAPGFDGNITSVVYRSQTQGTNNVTITYDVTASANLTSNPAYSHITWSIANTGVKAYTTFTQSAGSTPTPGEAYVEVVGNPLSAAFSDSSKTFQVIYHNATDWTIDTAGTGGGTQAVSVVDNTTSGNNKIYNYEAFFTANTGYEAITRFVWLQMHSGSEYKYGTVRIVQAGRQGTGQMTLRPEYARVASFSTESVFQVTASRNGINYGSLQLTGSSNVVVETVGGGYQESDDTYYYTYKVKYPQNNSSTPVTRSVTVKMEAASNNFVLKNYYVYQDPDTGGGTGTGISISPTSTTIIAAGTYASCVAYYYGVSDFSQISTPTTSTSGWAASVGQVQQSNGLTVVTWNFNGTANTGTGNRTINFTIGATGLSSKTFRILQLGTGGGGVTTVENVIPVWKRNIISGSVSGATLTVTSGSTTIFQDRIYPEPGSSKPQVDLNKICDPYVKFYNPWIPSGTDHETITDLVFGDTSNIPVFSALFESGERYTSYVLVDRSYEQVDLTGVLSELGTTPIKAALGQYAPLSLLNTGSNSVTYNFSWGGNISVRAKAYSHQFTKLQNCGRYIVYVSNPDVPSRVWDVSSNSNWVVYFPNKHGGWESLVLEGTVVPSVNVTRNNYLQGVYSYTRSYLNGVVDSWECNTGIVSDSESFLVSEMISAPDVILHDIKHQRFYYLRPNTNSIQKKTFWNQGRKFATYEFELESVLTQTRR